MIVGHPAVGKTRTIREGRGLYLKLPEPLKSPTSLTFASLVDNLAKSKRYIIQPPADPIEYNTMYINVDELGAFIHKYDNEMAAGLSAFFDPDPYSQARRTNDLKIKIDSPQINMLTGSTPQNLMQLMPESAWGQGFTSRLIMVFSDERIIGDDFALKEATNRDDLTHDLLQINNLMGQFIVTEEYRAAINDWRALGEPPTLSHPKLIYYMGRRRVNLYKLSMISAIDKSDALVIDKSDFNTAMGWLLEAEANMPEIFKAGATNADGQALDEIHHFVLITDRGQGVSEQAIIRFARERIPIHSIHRVIEILERSGQLHKIGMNSRTGFVFYAAAKPDGVALQ